DAVRAAEERSLAVNALFTSAHQKIILAVAGAFFRLGAARAQVEVTRDALERTRAVATAVEARYGRGIATSVALLEAKREVAQAEYNVSDARAGEVIAYSALIASVGIDPELHLEIATGTSRELPGRLARKAHSYVEAALEGRPDLRAARAL